MLIQLSIRPKTPIDAIRLSNARLFVIRKGEIVAKASPTQSELLFDTKKETNVIDWTLQYCINSKELFSFIAILLALILRRREYKNDKK